MYRFLFLTILVLSAIYCLPTSNFAYIFKTIDYDIANGTTYFYGINNNGVIVGQFTRYPSKIYGLTYDMNSESFNTIMYSENNSQYLTRFYGINSNNEIVGYATNWGKHRAFIYENNTFQTVNHPSGWNLYFFGLNDNGKIVGKISNGTDNVGIIYDKNNSSFSGINYYTGKNDTHLYDINNNNYCVGYSDTSALIYHGNFTVLNYPDAYWTRFYGINDNNQVVGSYKKGSKIYGLLYNIAYNAFITIDFSGASEIYLYDINNKGYIVGYYKDYDNKYHGLLILPDSPNRTVPEPNNIILLAIAFGPLILYIKKKLSYSCNK